MKEADALKFQKKLNEEPFVKETSYISKEQALKEQSEAMGTDPAEFLGYNPFTASIEIKLHFRRIGAVMQPGSAAQAALFLQKKYRKPGAIRKWNW